MKFVLLEKAKYTKLDSVQIQDLLNSGKYVKTPTPIYRGLKHQDFFAPFNTTPEGWLLNPDLNNLRRSRHTSNYYTEVVNNDPSWEKFPKRELICTNNFSTAKSYGSPYIIFPEKGAKIGVCPKDDIWVSFTEGTIAAFPERAAFISGYANDFNDWLKRQKVPEDYEKMKQSPLFKKIVAAFSPTVNGFELSSAETFDFSDKSREVWMDCECLAIRNDWYIEAFGEVK